MRGFFAELKRRHVYRVAVIYAAAGWLFVQMADVVLENFNLPAQLMQWLIVCTVAGFPLVLVLAWLYDLSFSGVQRTADLATAGAEGSSPNQEQQAASFKDERPGIVVLPFENFSGDPNDAVVCIGLTEDLTTLLAHIPGYFVISRNTASMYKDQKVDLREIGKELGVRYLLQGSLRRKGEQLRIAAQLIEAESGSHLWANNYDTPLDGLDQIQDALTQGIALQLGSELARAEFKLARRQRPDDMNAWSLYQNAKGTMMFLGWSQDSIRQAAAQLRNAIALDPNYAAPQAYLALLLAMGHWLRLVDDRPAAHDESIATANSALALQPDSSEVLGYVGCAISDLGYTQRGIPLLEKAIELDASNAQARAALGAALIASGELEQGIAALSNAVKISPKDPGLALWATILTIGAGFTDDMDGAEEWASLAYKSDARFFPALLVRAWVQGQKGCLQEAQTSLEEAARLYPELNARYVRGLMGEDVVQQMQQAGLVFAHA
ncbi:MAG: tetratricopeptide repeat protein [Pseudomonadales bacterium]